MRLRTRRKRIEKHVRTLAKCVLDSILDHNEYPDLLPIVALEMFYQKLQLYKPLTRFAMNFMHNLVEGDHGIIKPDF